MVQKAKKTMADGCNACQSLEQRIEKLEKENRMLRELLQMKTSHQEPCREVSPQTNRPEFSICSKEQVQRYGRQMLLKDFGINAQKKLCDSKILVIGAGGLGSPILMYLSTMGVGHIGITDHDRVEVTNLHRQIIHDESTIGELKVLSANQRIAQMNPLVQCQVYPIRFSSMNAMKLVSQYDLVLDASDNPQTRYLVNDACVLAGKPLVSGSAIGMEGQLTVLNYQNGPCYRCIYPKPMAKAQSCAENGVLGVVPGIIGCLQAMEAVKVLTEVGQCLKGYQCFYDSWDGSFRRFKLPARRPDCTVCGDTPSIVSIEDAVTHGIQTKCLDTQVAESIGQLQLPESHEITPQEFDHLRSNASSKDDFFLLDVRSSVQFEICHFPEAISIPIHELKKSVTNEKELMKLILSKKSSQNQKDHSTMANIYVICRRGIASVAATRYLIENGIQSVKNITGGYTRYAEEVDHDFPMY
jgi:adenylyltransferase/sulfurtransferase